MYTRSYGIDEERDVRVPPNYDGTAFAESDRDYAGTHDIGDASDAVATAGVGTDSGLSHGSLSRMLPFLKGIVPQDIFDGIGMPKIGKEELLLIGLAAFLFFSESGDKECAVILILLIFFT